MKRILTFVKRNFKEILRDPIIYIFCLGFPLVMLVLFAVINKYTSQENNVFELKSLLPGIIMFSFSFIMLLMSLNISKDRSTAFLKRLYTSPIKPFEFILGYALPVFIIGIFQSIICELFGFLLSLILNIEFFSFSKCILLILTQLPILIIYISLGIIFGTCLNEKSAPGLTSIFISLAGILGGAWMPLDALGNFEKIALAFPFYPSTYLGRIVTESYHTPIDSNITKYTFDNNALIGLIVLLIWLTSSIVLSCILFKKQMKK